MSHWHAERERLNHERFQHYFFDLIAQTANVDALDAADRVTALPHVLVQVLGSWEGLSLQFRSLFDRANPEALVDCELLLALVCPEDEHSKRLLDGARAEYADTIGPRLVRSRELLRKLDGLVLRARSKIGGDVVACTSYSEASLGSALLSTCREFSASVSTLRSLGDIPVEEDRCR